MHHQNELATRTVFLTIATALFEETRANRAAVKVLTCIFLSNLSNTYFHRFNFNSFQVKYKWNNINDTGFSTIYWLVPIICWLLPIFVWCVPTIFWAFPRDFCFNCIDIQSDVTNNIWERTNSLWDKVNKSWDEPKKWWDPTNKS